MPDSSDPVVLPDDVLRTVGADPSIQRVELTGSRASGRAAPLSDWDFRVVTADFDEVRGVLPQLVVPLRPVVAQWDRLSRSWCYMLILSGPAKVDLIFGEPHAALPPWRVGASTLRGIDDHFWDWMLWLRSKHAAGMRGLVAAELGKLHEHLLGPLGVAPVPRTIELAVTGYRSARDEWERRLGMRVPRAAEQAVIGVVDPQAATWPPGDLPGAGPASLVSDNERVHHQVPAAARGWLAGWCEQHLGSPLTGELFRAGHLATVVGARLADGREVVVRVRSLAARVTACVQVQRRLFESGYPCPQPLGVRAVVGGYCVTAESQVPGERTLPASGRLAGPFAVYLARLVDLAPAVSEVPSLEPAPPWTAWNHQEGGLWPWPDDQDADLNEVDGPGWVDDAGRAARQRLQAGHGEIVIGHGDWYPGNLRWRGDRLLVAYDWDSLIADSEAVIAGLAAAVYPTTGAGHEAAVAETEAFLAAYANARGRPFSPGELHQCWAAGVWVRAYEAKKQHASGQPVLSLTRAEARERLRRAGVR